MKRLSNQIFQVFFGSFIAAFGIMMFLYTQLGVDPISTLLLGVINYFPFKFGTLSQLFNLIVLIIVFLLDKKKIGLGSVVNGLSVGFFVNLLTEFHVEKMIPNLSYVNMVIGPLCLGIGTGIYLYANLGCGALEGLMVIISEKMHISIKYVRMMLDFLLVIIGILLGSIYGIGTILGILMIGPTIEVTISILNHLNPQKNKESNEIVNK